VHLRPRLQGVRRKVRHRQILAELAGLDRPAFGPQVGQNLLSEEEDCLVGISVRLLSPPTIEISLDTLGGDREVGHGSLREPARPALSGLETKLNDTTSHRILQILG
jgi:hypothetical protein